MARTLVVGYLLLAPAAETGVADLAALYDALGVRTARAWSRTRPTAAGSTCAAGSDGRRRRSGVGVALLATATDVGLSRRPPRPRAHARGRPAGGAARPAAPDGPGPGRRGGLPRCPSRSRRWGWAGTPPTACASSASARWGRSAGCRGGRLAIISGRRGWRSRRWRGGRTTARWCPARPPLVLAATRALDWPLGERAALAAGRGRLLDPLLAELRRRGLGATTGDAGARPRRVSARGHGPPCRSRRPTPP